jgi:hypothetical protein
MKDIAGMLWLGGGGSGVSSDAGTKRTIRRMKSTAADAFEAGVEELFNSVLGSDKLTITHFDDLTRLSSFLSLGSPSVNIGYHH